MVNDTIAKEEVVEEKKKKIPKEISQEILKKMFRNLLRAVGIMFYFIILNLAYSTMKQERLIGDIEVFAGAFLVVGIVFLEKAYKKDKGSIAITGIELLVLSLHSLSIMHIITLFKYDFRLYLLTSSYVFSIYYVLKAIVLYTKGRSEYVKSLSDISEIVKKDEPVIKEAKKRNEKEEEKSKTNKKSTQKKTSKIKNETIETPKEEEKATKKRTTKTKKKTQQKEKEEPTSKVKKNTTKTTKTTKAKKKDEKGEKAEEAKTPEKKKRGRPKKEVTKND